MTLLDLDLWLVHRQAEVESLLDERLRTSGEDPGRLVEAMRYSLLSKGKRLRPLLALAASEAIGVEITDPIRIAACSVELVHCYSLIHDDLPAMDNDDLRRGLPTNHKVFGDAIAVLAGDALLTLAFEWLAEAGQLAGPTLSSHYLRAMLALARGAGASGMVRGQARDITPSAAKDLETIETLHSEKTGALFRAALEVGGAIAGANLAQLEKLARFGTLYGIAFQHRDDRHDQEHQSLADRTQPRIHKLCEEAVHALHDFGHGADVLRSIAIRLGGG